LHGYTWKAIEADGLPIIERIESLIYSDHDAARLKGAALQLQVLAHVADKMRPDWLLFSRPGRSNDDGIMWSLFRAGYGSLRGRRSSCGNVDDMIRHAVSRLSHLLLTTHEDARQRLIRGGEEEWRVHNVGHAGLDRIRVARELSDNELARALQVPAIRRPYLVIVQHPLSSEINNAAAEMRETLAAAAETGFQTFVSYPNSDPAGSRLSR
jgi:GDP/UDP-N,N'-diacetylbacillosamine 2-epimerase (hydrolysing)